MTHQLLKLIWLSKVKLFVRVFFLLHLIILLILNYIYFQIVGGFVMKNVVDVIYKIGLKSFFYCCDRIYSPRVTRVHLSLRDSAEKGCGPSQERCGLTQKEKVVQRADRTCSMWLTNRILARLAPYTVAWIFVLTHPSGPRRMLDGCSISWTRSWYTGKSWIFIWNFLHLMPSTSQ